MAAASIGRELKAAEVVAFQRARLDALAQLYAQAENDVKSRLLGDDLTEFQAKQLKATERQIQIITDRLKAETAEWAGEQIPASYDLGIDVAKDQLERFDTELSKPFQTTIHTGAVDAIAQSMAADTAKAMAGVQTLTGNILRQSQLTGQQDKQVSRLVAQGIIEGGTRRQTSNRVLEDLRQQVRSGDWIQVGKRRMKMKDYAELIARTRAREAVTAGTVNTALEYGMDLVMIDIHDAACPYCQQFSGRVYSISGNHPSFPRLDQRPPFHPNCECTAHPTMDSHLKRKLGDKQYERLQQFSNDPTLAVDGQADYESLLGRESLAGARQRADIMNKRQTGEIVT